MKFAVDTRLSIPQCDGCGQKDTPGLAVSSTVNPAVNLLLCNPCAVVMSQALSFESRNSEFHYAEHRKGPN